MKIQADRLTALLEQINSGQSKKVLPILEKLLRKEPAHPGLLALRAEAVHQSGTAAEAIDAFRQAGEGGGGARNWLAAGILLAADRNTDEALHCLLRAVETEPGNDEILDVLNTTLFNANRHAQGIEYARRQLATGTNVRFLSNAALLLQSNDLYEESTDAFRKILALAGDDPTVLGAALVPARFTCDWEWIESLQQKILAWYAEGRFDAPCEYPLTHTTWCTNEAYNLGVSQAYIERMVAKAEPCARAPSPGPGARLRVGYLSCDFRHHATMHLMAGLFECHDRDRFEVFAYDYSSADDSNYRQRFVAAVEHLVPIHTLSDQQAAARIADDQLDILFDLKGYTGGGRAGILAYRPVSLQAAYLGYPGSAATTDIDYIVSDRFVTPDSSSAYYTEQFCRLPHSYQCNDRKRVIAPAPGARAQYGLPEDKVVFGAFNQSYKIDRASFAVWLRILGEVPDSVLWLLGQSESCIKNLTHYAQLGGIGPERLVFAPFAAPQEHLARLQLADAVLDTLVCNGHTTTSDALWAGVPVITAHGSHFASRVSESLLNAIDLPELVGADHDDMVRIAHRIGTDADYRQAIRASVAANRLTSPLFDTARFTRNFEAGIEAMVQASAGGKPAGHIDVAESEDTWSRRTDGTDADANPPVLQTAYPACPLCAGASTSLGFANCTMHGLWHHPLPQTIEWMTCPSCGHVHNRHYWTEAGLAEVFRNANASQLAEAVNPDAKRATWAPVVARVVGLLGGYQAVIKPEGRPIWVDVGCGDGGLVATASDYGFAAIGLDARAEAVSRIQALGMKAMQADFMELSIEVVVDVLSMMDVLEHIAYPADALRKAARVLRPGGLIVISMPDMACSSWKTFDAVNANPYWLEIEHYHNFSRDRLIALLNETGFDVVDFAIPNRYKAQMEVYAVRR
jgi:protein O-GlcNAc transferase